jgi:hypothetical protein
MNIPLFFKISTNETLLDIDNFLRIYKDLLQSDDEDYIVKSLTNNLVTKAYRKYAEASSEKILFHTQCTLNFPQI